MANLVMFGAGLVAGIVLDALLEKRVVTEVEKLHTYVAAEFQKLAAKL